MDAYASNSTREETRLSSPSLRIFRQCYCSILGPSFAELIPILQDLIGGSSSGGVVAILLGRLRVSIDKCLEIYTKRSKEVFGQPQWGWGVWQSKFDHNILESIIFEELPAACGSTNIPGPTTDLPEASINPRSMMMRDINVDNSCGVFVTATPGRDAQKGYPTLFRTYQDPYSTRTSNIKIWEALRATCAAPTFFDPIDIDGCTYVDGGFGCNNPVSLVYEEARERWPNRNIECILSFGSGMGRTLSLPNPTHLESRFPKHWIQALERNATECESAHQDMLGRRELNGKYFRFNVEQGLESVSLIDWEKLGEIVLKTEAYVTVSLYPISGVSF